MKYLILILMLVACGKMPDVNIQVPSDSKQREVPATNPTIIAGDATPDDVIEATPTPTPEVTATPTPTPTNVPDPLFCHQTSSSNVYCEKGNIPDGESHPVSLQNTFLQDGMAYQYIVTNQYNFHLVGVTNTNCVTVTLIKVGTTQGPFTKCGTSLLDNGTLE